MPPFPPSERVRRWPVRTYVTDNNVELYTPSNEDAEAVYGETNDRPLLGDLVTASSLRRAAATSKGPDEGPTGPTDEEGPTGPTVHTDPTVPTGPIREGLKGDESPVASFSEVMRNVMLEARRLVWHY